MRLSAYSTENTPTSSYIGKHARWRAADLVYPKI